MEFIATCHAIWQNPTRNLSRTRQDFDQHKNILLRRTPEPSGLDVFQAIYWPPMREMSS
jgi:hypothetical protein